MQRRHNIIMYTYSIIIDNNTQYNHSPSIHQYTTLGSNLTIKGLSFEDIDRAKGILERIDNTHSLLMNKLLERDE